MIRPVTIEDGEVVTLAGPSFKEYYAALRVAVLTALGDPDPRGDWLPMDKGAEQDVRAVGEESHG